MAARFVALTVALFCACFSQAVRVKRRMDLTKNQKQAVPKNSAPKRYGCKAVLSHADSFDTLWAKQDEPEWQQCLSCNFAKMDTKKLKKGNKCSKKDCAAIEAANGSQLCHRVKFAFNTGVWQRNTNGSSMQPSSFQKPQCVPCELEELAEEVIPSQISDGKTAGTDEILEITDERDTDVIAESEVIVEPENKCKNIDSHPDSLQIVWENVDEPDWYRCLSCDETKTDLHKVNKGNKCSKSACNAILRDDGTPACHKLKFAFGAGAWEKGQQPSFHWKPQCVPCMPENIKEEVNSSQTTGTVSSNDKDKDEILEITDERDTDVIAESEVTVEPEDKCKKHDSHSDSLQTVWGNEDEPEWYRCLSCDGTKTNLHKVNKGNKCSKSACDAILKDDGTPACHKLKFAFGTGAWRKGEEPSYLWKPQCVPCES